MRLTVGFAALTLTLADARLAFAQCADGSAPPCAKARIASAPTRKVPPLDDGTWIVVPFNNVTRSADVDYLRDASVNLLYLDMSRWSDIRVVDDARVADLIKEVPEAHTMPLSLDAALAVAKRAGAGRLVMGSVIKQGARTTLAAKVFDVRRGAVIRSPQQDLIVQDSLMSVFGKLAGAILNVAPPAGTNIADVGTTRADAYQEYLAGSTALKRFDLVEARTRLTAALKLDSNFALAHYKLAIVIGWDTPNDIAKVTHAAAAARLSGGLPLRERILMQGLSEFERQTYAVSCATYSKLITADSSDVEALYGIGECTYHDIVVVANAADTARRVHRSSYNTAIRIFSRVVELDPAYHLAYQHILDALSAERRSGLDRSTCPASSPGVFQQRCMMVAIVRRQGDSLVTEPVSVTDTAAVRLQMQEAMRVNARRRSLALARDQARVWVDAAPGEGRAHIELGSLYTVLGDYGNAEQQFAQVTGKRTETEIGKMMPARMEIAVKTGRGDVARQVVDSVLGAPQVGNGNGPRMLAIVVGRFAPFDSLMRATMARQSGAMPPIVLDYGLVAFRAAIAGGDARMDSLERKMSDIGPTMPTSALQIGTYVFAPRRPRTWVAFEYSADPRHSALVALSKGDTARLRAETRAIDSTLRAQPAFTPDSGAGLLASELYLALRDSVAALRVVRRMLDTTMLASSSVGTPLLSVGGAPALIIWPRLALLRGDLEAAVGYKIVAREWYKRFLDLWANADPEFQPIVERARKSLAALGSP